MRSWTRLLFEASAGILGGLSVLDLNVEFGIADPEKQSFLERVLELAAGVCWRFYCPRGTEVSDRMPGFDIRTSGQYLSGGEAGSAA